MMIQTARAPAKHVISHEKSINVTYILFSLAPLRVKSRFVILGQLCLGRVDLVNEVYMNTHIYKSNHKIIVIWSGNKDLCVCTNTFEQNARESYPSISTA